MVKNKNYIFDNSNLTESYAGVTTPLTFSFARRAYKKVYISLCEFFGVSRKDMKTHTDLFANMLEYLGGRMYYNLINWYRLIAFFPGYKFNRTFFEHMLGVEEEYKHTQKNKISVTEKTLDIFHFGYRMIRMSVAFVLMPWMIKKFNKEFDENFAYLESIRLENMADSELTSFYKIFEERLTKAFRIPIANDFAVMISMGVLRSLSKKWLFDRNEEKLNAFIVHTKGLKSAEPGYEVQKILSNIANNHTLRKLFTEQPPRKILQLLHEGRQFASLNKKINRYISTYGYRVPGELKLESISFQDNPLTLVKILKNSHKNHNKRVIKQSRYIVKKELHQRSLVQRYIFYTILRWARYSIKAREETRFRRTLIFGVARKIFQECGRRLQKQGKIKTRRDVFYLHVEEIFLLLNNTKTITNARSRIKKRKIIERIWKRIETPRRIITKKSSKEYNKQLIKMKMKRRSGSVRTEGVKGQLASLNGKKVIMGISLVLTNFDPNQDYTDKILVTRQTDPGWTMIFPALKGIVVERGGMLSHAAIVAREFGIPCIINATDATKIIPNGTKIKMELTKGFVTLNG